jgi:hypothetical protein
MSARSRLALLMLATIPAVIVPPNRPAGNPSGVVPVATVPCPKGEIECGGQGQFEAGYRYRCDVCDDTFYYCSTCSTQLTRDEAAEHVHSAS